MKKRWNFQRPGNRSKGVNIAPYRARIGSFSPPLKIPRWKDPAIMLGKREVGLYRFFVLATLLYTSVLCDGEAITRNINIPQQYIWNIITAYWCVTSQLITLRPWTKTAIVGSNHLYLIIETVLLCSGLETIYTVSKIAARGGIIRGYDTLLSLRPMISSGM